jgi:amino-acid N-acetyltransferase
VTAARIHLRRGRAVDAPALQALIDRNRESGHLLPRTLSDLRAHAPRFSVLTAGSCLVGGAELVPLTSSLGEVRSLVVHERHRGLGLGARLIESIKARARACGMERLCAFTHDPTPFRRWAFGIVPHGAVPEKIAADCRGCALFGSCGQYAVVHAIAGVPELVPDRAVAGFLEAR